MSLDDLKNFRGYLCSSSAVISLVPKSNIQIGWPRDKFNMPSIIITQVTGTDIGYLGYRTAAAGSRVRREELTFQVDIYAKNRKDTYSIADTIVPILIVSGACRKNSDNDMYNDDLRSYRKSQSYSFISFKED